MKRSTKILIGILVLLGIAFVVQRITYRTSTTENSSPFSKIDTSKVIQISIARGLGGEETVIDREGRGWFIVSPMRFPASRSEVNLLLSAVAGDPIASVVSDNLVDSLAYGLDAQAPILSLSENGQEGVSLRIGNVTPDYDGCYVEIVGDRKILDLAKNLRSYAAESLTNWRDKRIFDFSLGDVQAADFALGDTLYHFMHVNTAWQVNGRDVPNAKVHEVIGDFIGTMAIDFVDSSFSWGDSAIDYGFSISGGARDTGKIKSSTAQAYISNSSVGQTYVIGSVILESLERGLREISRDYLDKGTAKR